MTETSSQRKPSFKLACCAVVMAVCVIVLGAFTRLVDAGLGCPDWPGCYGHVLWPTSTEDVQAAEEAFPHAPVEHDKTWPEMVHRYLATGLGVFTIALVITAVRNRGPAQPFKLPLFLLGFIILQGMFGMWTVTLKLWPQIVTAHLLGGFTTLSLLWLMVLRLNNSPWRIDIGRWQQLQSMRSWALAGLLMVIVQITLGGWTTSNYADIACPDLPTCQGQWWPDMDVANGFNFTQSIGPNYLGGTLDNDARVAIHMGHRIGALFTLAIVGALIFRLLRSGQAVLVRQGQIIGVVLFVQFMLGLSNIWFNFPLYVTVSHNAVGAFLLLTLVTLNFYLRTAQRIQ